MADNTRIANIDRIRTCYIMYQSEAVGELIHEYSSITKKEDWVIRPYYEPIKRLGYLAEIPGVDLDLELKAYIRQSPPILVTQRVPPAGREDVKKDLVRYKMERMDKFEYMCRGHAVCGDNRLYISRTPDDNIDANTKEGRMTVNIPDFDTEEYGWVKDSY